MIKAVKAHPDSSGTQISFLNRRNVKELKPPDSHENSSQTVRSSPEKSKHQLKGKSCWALAYKGYGNNNNFPAHLLMAKDTARIPGLIDFDSGATEEGHLRLWPGGPGKVYTSAALPTKGSVWTLFGSDSGRRPAKFERWCHWRFTVISGYDNDIVLTL